MLAETLIRDIFREMLKRFNKIIKLYEKKILYRILFALVFSLILFFTDYYIIGIIVLLMVFYKFIEDIYPNSIFLLYSKYFLSFFF